MENVCMKSTSIFPLTTRALEGFSCGYFSPKWQRKGSEKTLNPNGCCMKYMYGMVQDDLMGSLNTCRSLCNVIILGH